MNLRDLKRLLEPLSNRINALVGIGRLRRINPGSEQYAQVEMLEDELRDKLLHHMPYGFCYVPQDGAEPFVVFMRGDKSDGLVLQVRDPRYQPTLAKGESALYDDQTQTVHIKRDGIVVKSHKKVTMDTPTAYFTGDVEIAGECTINGIKFTPHYHPESIGSQTGPPKS